MVPVVSLQRGSVVRASVSFRLRRNLQPAVPAAPPPASPRAATSLAAAVAAAHAWRESGTGPQSRR